MNDYVLEKLRKKAPDFMSDPTSKKSLNTELTKKEFKRVEHFADVMGVTINDAFLYFLYRGILETHIGALPEVKKECRERVALFNTHAQKRSVELQQLNQLAEEHSGS